MASNKNDSVQFICPKCQQSFKKQTGLDKHIKEQVDCDQRSPNEKKKRQNNYDAVYTYRMNNPTESIKVLAKTEDELKRNYEKVQEFFQRNCPECLPRDEKPLDEEIERKLNQ